MHNADATLLQRFMRYVEVDEATGCWLWQGGANQDGYGRWRHPELKRMLTAHHAAWLLHGRPAVPEGYELDHTCVTPRCCNPAHLDPCTGEENRRRSWERRGLLHKCKAGHPRSGDNLYTKPCGQRVCMACARLYRTRYNAKARAARTGVVA